MRPDRPNRSPDAVINDVWEFFFTEMLQYNNEEKITYTLRIEDKMYHCEDGHWDMEYDSDWQPRIKAAHQQYLIERAIFDE